MTEYSYPIEEQPMPSEHWKSVTLGIGSGVLDEGGAPYRMININNANNTVTVAVDQLTKYSHAILRGFYHKIDANVTLDIPAVTTATTYYIALQLHPVRATEGDLPVKLGVFTSLERTDDRDYLVLHTIRRQPNQLLTDAVFTKSDIKIAPQMMVDTVAGMPPADTVLWGTTMIVRLPYEVLYQSRGDTGGREWVKLLELRPPGYAWKDMPATENAKWAGHGTPKQIKRVGDTCTVRGRIDRQNGTSYTSNSADGYRVGGLGDDSPRYSQSFPVRCSGGATGYVDVSAANQEIRLYITAGSCAYVDLPSITWDVV